MWLYVGVEHWRLSQIRAINYPYILPTMNKLVVRNTSIGPLLTLKKPKSSLPNPKYLQSLPSRAMYLAAYRRMFRLRHLVGSTDRDLHTFENLLRRRFTRIDFDIRRSQVLGLDQRLTKDEMALRLANSIAFIFNSTCNRSDTIPPVDFYEDVQAATVPRIETSVISTILLMDHQAPPGIKYDFAYKWVDETKAFYHDLQAESIGKKEINRLYNTGVAGHMGFLQYEESVMALNESYSLCL